MKQLSLLLVVVTLITGCAGTMPLVKFQQFGTFYQSAPPSPQPATATTEGAQPNAPSQATPDPLVSQRARAVIAPHKTYRSKWDNPRIFVVKNCSDRVGWFKVDDNEWEKLEPFMSSDDSELPYGPHMVRSSWEVPGPEGKPTRTTPREEMIHVSLEGRAQIHRLPIPYGYSC